MRSDFFKMYFCIKSSIRTQGNVIRLLHALITRQFILLGPVVQSVVSLTSSLRVISLIVLADSIYNILIFFAEKM